MPNDLEPPQNTEEIRNAKGWLGARMAVTYDPMIHQLEFSRCFDLQEARANSSFNCFYEHIRIHFAETQ